MVYHQLLVCHEGNIVVPLNVAPWWPTLQGFHGLQGVMCTPHFESSIAVPPLPSNCMATPGGTVQQWFS